MAARDDGESMIQSNRAARDDMYIVIRAMTSRIGVVSIVHVFCRFQLAQASSTPCCPPKAAKKKFGIPHHCSGASFATTTTLAVDLQPRN